MAKDRANLGFETDEAEDEDFTFNPAVWNPKAGNTANDRPAREEVRAAAAQSGFQSRQPEAKASARKDRRRRTGRNAQINIKTRPDVIERFYQLADANDLGLGETFEAALDAFEGSLAPPGEK